MIDNEEFAGPIGRLEFQPKMLDYAKNRWDGRIRRRAGLTSKVAAREEPGRGRIGRKFQVDIKLPSDPGLVDDRAV